MVDCRETAGRIAPDPAGRSARSDCPIWRPRRSQLQPILCRVRVVPTWKIQMEWVLLVIGAVVGAVLSLVVDRLVRRYIEVPTVRVHSSVLYSHDSGQSFNLEVTNAGSVALPPYE